MNWEQVEGNWLQLKGRIRQKWGKLTDDDLEIIAGKKDVLNGQLQEKYGLAKHIADKEIDSFARDIDDLKAEDEKSRTKTGP